MLSEGAALVDKAKEKVAWQLSSAIVSAPIGGLLEPTPSGWNPEHEEREHEAANLTGAPRLRHDSKPKPKPKPKPDPNPNPNPRPLDAGLEHAAALHLRPPPDLAQGIARAPPLHTAQWPLEQHGRPAALPALDVDARCAHACMYMCTPSAPLCTPLHTRCTPLYSPPFGAPARLRRILPPSPHPPVDRHLT